MRDQEISFLGPDMFARAQANKDQQAKAFDWENAAKIIKSRFSEDPNISVEAGLCGDWSYTGGSIFANGKIVTDEYTYLSSTWATPAMIITFSDGNEIEIPCFETEGKYDSDSKWPEEAIQIFNQKQLDA